MECYKEVGRGFTTSSFSMAYVMDGSYQNAICWRDSLRGELTTGNDRTGVDGKVRCLRVSKYHPLNVRARERVRDRQTDRHIDRQTDGRTDRQIDR